MPQTTKSRMAAWAGFDLSTTGLGLGVRSEEGDEAYVHVDMRGRKTWHGQPAFALEHAPRMIQTLIDKLAEQDWAFDGTFISFAVRQHDMVLLDSAGQLLMPALSWQCHAACQETHQLRKQGAEDVVGRVEERFILPKLMWALRQDRRLGKAIHCAMTTGDWIAYRLTGAARLSTSDALSNGLLVQKSKRLAADVMCQAKLQPEWFPRVVQSGTLVGVVKPIGTDEAGGRDWDVLRKRLAGSRIVSCLGDNHATGVGCGLREGDYETIVVSAGTSGTVNRVCGSKSPLAGKAACFEYYSDRLLLMMLADCCAWYDRFVARYAPEYVKRLDALNDQVERADLGGTRRVLHERGKETYPPDWDVLSVGQKAASTQLSIMLELLFLVRAMLNEVVDAETKVRNFVLTGGLSQSPFFQKVFDVGVRMLNPRARLLISARQGPLRHQTAAYGALLNSMRPRDMRVAARLCPTRAIAQADAPTRQHVQYLLRSFGL